MEFFAQNPKTYSDFLNSFIQTQCYRKGVPINSSENPLTAPYEFLFGALPRGWTGRPGGSPLLIPLLGPSPGMDRMAGWHILPARQPSSGQLTAVCRSLAVVCGQEGGHDIAIEIAQA